MKFEIIECRRKHIKEICKNLREEDERELAEMSGNTPLGELLRCRLYSQAAESWAVVDEDKVLMVYGLYKPGVANATAKMWMACSKDISLANKFIVREMCGVIIEALNRYDVLLGDVDQRHKKAVKFFKRVGCELTPSESITGLSVFKARLTRELFLMSKANHFLRRCDFRLEYLED